MKISIFPLLRGAGGGLYFIHHRKVILIPMYNAWETALCGELLKGDADCQSAKTYLLCYLADREKGNSLSAQVHLFS
jgi:hypothetical protein